MPLGPRFSAVKFQSVLKGALGAGSDAVRGSLMHIGAQNSLKTGADLKTARATLSKLEKTGAVKDVARAEREFHRAEKTAVYAARVQQNQMREDRLNAYRAEKTAEAQAAPASAPAGVVREQAHSVSIAGDAASQHRISISQSATQRAVSSSSSSSARAVAAQKPAARTTPMDVMID